MPWSPVERKTMFHLSRCSRQPRRVARASARLWQCVSRKTNFRGIFSKLDGVLPQQELTVSADERAAVKNISSRAVRAVWYTIHFVVVTMYRNRCELVSNCRVVPNVVWYTMPLCWEAKRAGWSDEENSIFPWVYHVEQYCTVVVRRILSRGGSYISGLLLLLLLLP